MIDQFYDLAYFEYDKNAKGYTPHKKPYGLRRFSLVDLLKNNNKILINSFCLSISTHTHIYLKLLFYATHFTAFSAASFRSLATIMLYLPLFNSANSDSNFPPISPFVPVNLTTSGRFRPTSFVASIIPFAIISPLIIPPKMFTNMALLVYVPTIFEMLISLAEYSHLLLHPKKFAGRPPFNLIISIVDIANPAPFTIHPMLPSSPT